MFLEIFSGARRGELCGLTWENVNFEDNTIYISLNRTGSTKKVLDVLTSPKTHNGIRTLPLPLEIMRMLKEEKELQNKNRQLFGENYKEYEYDFVLRKQDGSTYHPNSLNRISNNILERLGLPHCRIHDYRHAVASILFENGSSVRDVSVQLGHGQTSTTERIYIHRQNTASQQNVNILSQEIKIEEILLDKQSPQNADLITKIPNINSKMLDKNKHQNIKTA